MQKRSSSLYVCGGLDDVYHCLMECAENSIIGIKVVKKFNFNKLYMGMYHSILVNSSDEFAKML